MRLRKKKTAIVYTDELKAELDKRYKNYQNGIAETLTAEESKKRIQEILARHRNKKP